MIVKFVTLSLILLLHNPARTEAISSCSKYDNEAVCVCTGGEEIKAVCEYAGLEIIPHDLPTQLTSLDLSYNNILKLDNVNMYDSLIAFKLTHNNLTTIGQDCFINNKNLQKLELSYNCLTELNHDTFVGLYSLIALDLSNNEISSIQEDSFASMSSLQDLNLGSNQLVQLNHQAFQVSHRNTLHHLDLSHNFFREFPTMALSKLVSLRVLHLGHNNLEYLSDRVFSKFQHLMDLKLNKCGLEDLGEFTFAELETLQQLDISDNKFTDVPEAALNQLINLETIFIGGNDIRILNSNHFSKLSQLKQFNMQDCKGELQLESGVFVNNPDLTTINITRCDLEDPDESIRLNYLHKLEHVNLHGNKLTTWRQDFLPMTDLLSLDLSGNPINCDCDLKWLRHWPIHNPDMVLKASCYNYDDQTSLLAVNPEDFTCGLALDLILWIVLSIVGSCLVMGVIAVLCIKSRRTQSSSSCECSRLTLPSKHSFVSSSPCWKRRHESKPRLSRNFSGKQDILVIQNDVENNGKLIDLPPGQLNSQDSSLEDENAHLYDTVPGDECNLNYPDVKITQI